MPAGRRPTGTTRTCAPPDVRRRGRVVAGISRRYPDLDFPTGVLDEQRGGGRPGGEIHRCGNSPAAPRAGTRSRRRRGKRSPDSCPGCAFRPDKATAAAVFTAAAEMRSVRLAPVRRPVRVADTLRNPPALGDLVTVLQGPVPDRLVLVPAGRAPARRDRADVPCTASGASAPDPGAGRDERVQRFAQLSGIGL